MTTQISFTGEAIAQLDRMFAAHSKELRELAANMARQAGGMGSTGMPGIRQPGGSGKEGLNDAATELKSFIAVLKDAKGKLSATEKYRLLAAQRELTATEEKIKAIKDETDADRENAKAAREAADAQAKHADKVKSTSKDLHNFAEKVVSGTLQFTAASRAINEFSQAYKQGFNWNAIGDSMKAAIDMGMSPKDMMDFQKRFRRVSNTLEGGVSEFNTTIAGSNKEWLHFTGSLKDAAIAQAEFADLALSMGVGGKDVKNAVGGMFQEFKKLQAATSMTAEEFVATQKSLLAEKIVRDKIIGLQGKERTNYMLKLTDTSYMFQTLGMQKEAAESLVKALENQANKGFVGRVKEGAQAQAAAGLFGMGGQDGADIRSLMQKRNRTKEEDDKLTGLAAKFAEKFYAEQNKGGFDEARADAIRAQLGGGVDTLLELGSPRAQVAGAGASQIAIQKQQDDINKRDTEFYGTIKENIVKIANIMDGWSQSALAALLAAALAKYGFSLISKLTGKIMPGPGGGPPPPGGGPPVPPGPGSLGKLGAMMKTGAVAAVIGMAASAAVATITDDQKTQDIANSAITGASLGATIGALGGPIGIAVGTAVGGIGGLVVGIIQNQETVEDSLAKQKKQLTDQTSMDEIRYRMSKENYETELKALNEKSDIQQKDLDRQKELRKLLDDNDKEHNANKATIAAGQFGYQMNQQGATKDWMAQAASSIKNGGFFSDTSSGDVKGMLSSLRTKLSTAGMDISEEELNQRFGTALKGIAGTKGATERDQGYFAAANLTEGADIEYVAKIANPMIAEAMTKLADQFQGGFAATNQATFSTKFNTPEAVMGVMEQVKSTVDQLTKDKAELAGVQATAMFDESGFSVGEAAKIQKRIETSQATLDALQQLAAKDNTVKFQSEDKLLEVLQKLSESLKTGNPPMPLMK